MQSSKWPIYASALLLAGGLSWIVKIGVIVANDGRIITTGPAALLMSAGLVLLGLGAAVIGAWLARRAHPVLRLLAALAAVGVLVACSIALGWGGSTLFRGRGPAYLAEEVGLLTAALLWCAFGAAGWRGPGVRARWAALRPSLWESPHEPPRYRRRRRRPSCSLAT
jgi:hypothetical protein